MQKKSENSSFTPNEELHTTQNKPHNQNNNMFEPNNNMVFDMSENMVPVGQGWSSHNTKRARHTDLNNFNETQERSDIERFLAMPFSTTEIQSKSFYLSSTTNHPQGQHSIEQVKKERSSSTTSSLHHKLFPPDLLLPTIASIPDNSKDIIPETNPFKNSSFTTTIKEEFSSPSPPQQHSPQDTVSIAPTKRLLPLTPSDVATATTRFVLRYQPNPNQRKSYSNENRYLLPNPTVLIAKEFLLDDQQQPLYDRSLYRKVVSGKAQVTMVDGFGDKLSKPPTTYLEGNEDSLESELNAELGIFEFFLKVRENSGPNKFRLHFQVSYTTEDGEVFSEEVVSNPFLVQSNKSFFSKDPKLKSIIPASGPPSRSIEVWIRGRDFNEKGVSVTFDGIEGTVTEALPNLITVWTPLRPDLLESKRVPVSVSNLFKQKTVPSEFHIDFTYDSRIK